MQMWENIDILSVLLPRHHLQAAEGGQGAFTHAFLSWAGNNDLVSTTILLCQTACNTLGKITELITCNHSYPSNQQKILSLKYNFVDSLSSYVLYLFCAYVNFPFSPQCSWTIPHLSYLSNPSSLSVYLWEAPKLTRWRDCGDNNPQVWLKGGFSSEPVQAINSEWLWTRYWNSQICFWPLKCGWELINSAHQQ